MNVSDAKICGHCNKIYDCMQHRTCPFCQYDIGIFVQKCIESSCENKLKAHNCELEKKIHSASHDIDSLSAQIEIEGLKNKSIIIGRLKKIFQELNKNA